MTEIQEIEEKIARLPRGEFFELVRRLQERHADEWDRQIEEDARSGKLRRAYDHLQSGNQGKPKIPLDQVLDDPEFS